MTTQYYLQKKGKFNRLLLDWWRKNKRDFPWRQTDDPYSILIAEMLLRKTTSKQVEKVYDKFIKKYPSYKKLSKAKKKDLVELLRPLGIEYQRANLFINFGCAIEDLFDGRIPNSYLELRKLPGIGQYSANAVLSLSSNQKAPMLDTNFIRIMDRIFGIKSSKSRAHSDPQIWQMAGRLIPDGYSRDFNLAVLDFGAIQCNARNPDCSSCPFISFCRYCEKNE